MVKKPQCACPHTTTFFSLIGKKWSLFIMHAIASGAHSFTEIRKNAGDVNTKILTDRLHELVEAGLIEKCQTEGSYGLTKRGTTLTEKMLDIAHWWSESEKKM